jgi:hypothetical protein
VLNKHPLRNFALFASLREIWLLLAATLSCTKTVKFAKQEILAEPE